MNWRQVIANLCERANVFRSRRVGVIASAILTRDYHSIVFELSLFGWGVGIEVVRKHSRRELSKTTIGFEIDGYFWIRP